MVRELELIAYSWAAATRRVFRHHSYRLRPRNLKPAISPTEACSTRASDYLSSAHPEPEDLAVVRP
jgi:hypothetical protein